MDIALWIVQVLLAVAFIGVGFGHATGKGMDRPGLEWTQAVPPGLLTTIGVLEILGAIGLILPAITGIAPILTPIAAAALTILMACAAAFHLRRAGETRNAISNIVLMLVAAFVAYGRFFLEPFS